MGQSPLRERVRVRAMTPGQPRGPGLPRHFTVAVFVVHEGRVLLHFHPKLGIWLPPGGHIEPNELPDEAAVREVEEETGVHAELAGEKALPIAYPVQLVRPAGIQVENIPPDHQHIDLVYFAKPILGHHEITPAYAEQDHVGWYDPEELSSLGVSEEVQAWVAKALAAVG